jgi:hypothetical protein
VQHAKTIIAISIFYTSYVQPNIQSSTLTSEPRT